MSPLITTEWDLVIVGAAFGTITLGFVMVWAMCRAAALADRAMERKVCEDLERR
ncbi:MAG: hypothetical protein H8K10_15625 [Nitrospira sp.]|nr:hypothetical protein [Nitrospira sp.]